ncbi:hypothetical protein [Evansella tamaricis]|uniref:ABC transporter permease n=1 Tax=Evansella tamaricis TaxID=2069301 RepID=A0ABS6JM93_9BACI|nr:hypothetical protein [Evansella tamaricis]MBU9714790.1 hypothetical protein [Evansella tamaricis]
MKRFSHALNKGKFRFSFGQVNMFLKGDARNIFRDPLMILVLMIPIIMFFLVQYGIPYVDDQLSKYTTFQLLDHRTIIIGFILIMTPMMVGMLTGFLLLDEKDDGIFSYMEITPMKKMGFIGYRITLPVIISLIISVIMGVIFLSDESKLNWGLLGLSILSISLYGPIITMYLASLCNNKVEGMTYTKMISILTIAPFASYLFDNWWTVIAYLIPFTWGVELLFASITGEYFGLVRNWFGLFIGSMANNVIILWLFYKKLQNSL